MTEQGLERNFVEWCKSKNIQAVKGPVTTSKGFPDRFVQLPNGGGTIYVEFKGTSDYGLSPLQLWWSEYIKQSSPHRYFLVDDEAKLERLKRACLAFMKVGAAIVAYEKRLLIEVCGDSDKK